MSPIFAKHFSPTVGEVGKTKIKMKDGKLQVGDVLYTERFGDLRRYKVERVTKTMAMSDRGLKFKMDIHDGWVRIIGAGSWGPFSAMIETQELKDKYQTIELRVKLESGIKKLSLDQLRRINDILDENE